MFRCYPTQGRGWDPEKLERDSHAFVHTREHTTEDHPNGDTCFECQVKPEPHQGPLINWNWDFAVRLIVEALLLVGRGMSYRKAAQQLRVNGRRFRQDETGLPVVSLYGGTTQRYLDVFAPMVVDAVRHRTWPRILLLDAMPVRERVLTAGGAKTLGGGAAGAFLVACGYTEPVEQNLRPQRMPADAPDDWKPTWRWTGPKRLPHVWQISVSGGLDEASWRDFLDQLDGEPEYIVTDGDDGVTNAIKAKWGGRPVLYSCEGHLIRTFQKTARADGWTPNAAVELFGNAFRNPTEWRAFVVRLMDLPDAEVAGLTEWVARESPTVVAQMALRKPGYPRGIGALESVIEQLDDWIGKRRKVFQNVRRTNLALALMCAQLGAHADAARYSKIIRSELEAVDAHPDIDWRKHHDKVGRRGLWNLVKASSMRAKAASLVRNVSARNRSIEGKVILADAYRATLGFPPLVINRTAKTVSINMHGQMLTDRPEITRNWDTAANPTLRLEDLKASYGKPVNWFCLNDPTHTWATSPRSRCATLAGCPECGRRKRGARKGMVSLATVAAGLAPDPGAAPDTDDLFDMHPPPLDDYDAPDDYGVPDDFDGF